jgi:acetyl esterase/lipase
VVFPPIFTSLVAALIWTQGIRPTLQNSLLDYAAMKTFIIRTLCLVVFLAPLGAAQDVIPLYPGTAPGSTQENYPEKEYFSKNWNEEVVANVTKPTLTVFKPSAELRNGTAVVICPGGGFMALAINSEGSDVAKYLAAKGVTAFVLKYRIAHTGEDATQEFTALFADKQKFREILDKVVPLSIADGLAAVTYVRQHASDWGVSPDRVGIIGFSAGGTVSAGVAFGYAPDGRPAFAALIYAAGGRFKDSPVPVDAPPVFVAAATDDNLGLAPDSVALYEKWTSAHKPAELHMYAKGGHGFGMRTQNLPTDHWIDRFADWLELQGWLKK